MAEIVISPATADRFDDAEHALTGGGDGRTCQCQWWMMPNAQFERLSTDERTALLRDELEHDAVPPALIAYVDGEAAGWVRVGPRTAQVRLARTRAVTSTTQLPLDDPDVWAVTCFVVRREHRGAGLSERLLDAAIAFARDHGARAIEAYPVDPTVRKRSSNELFHGVVSAFESAGFREVGRPRPDRAVVVLEL